MPVMTGAPRRCARGTLFPLLPSRAFVTPSAVHTGHYGRASLAAAGIRVRENRRAGDHLRRAQTPTPCHAACCAGTRS